MQQSITKLFFLLGLLPLLGGCSLGSGDQNSQTPCDRSSDIRGTIVTVSSPTSQSGTNYVGSIFIDGTKEKQKVQYPKVMTIVNASTQIFEKQGSTCRTVTFTALKSGQRVMIQSTGGAALSSPPQITATQIVIVPAEG
jgi:hypothetical protein